MEIFLKSFDKVIQSEVGVGYCDYNFALKNFYPLIDRFEAQRRSLDSKLYARLEKDILVGCVMPPITIAFVKERPSFENKEELSEYLLKNIESGYILDGIQRLNTLKRASENSSFPSENPIFFNVIISENQDKLLYRMITLNNGQKPMTPKHQIEILTKSLFDFTQYKNLRVQTEKEKSVEKIPGALSVADISKGYLSFLTENVHNESNKIIEEKMDEIIVGRILEAKVISDSVSFKEVLRLIDSKVSDKFLNDWMKVSNNLIGFCYAIKFSFNIISNESIDETRRSFRVFEHAFGAIKPAKVNLGKYRRELSGYFVKNYADTKSMDENELIGKFLEKTAS